jgi:hypothetical protein
MTDRNGVVEGTASVRRSTTDRHGLPIPRAASDLDLTRQARAALLSAKRAHDPADIATACLDLVGNLIDAHRGLAASWVLEDTIEELESLANECSTSDVLWTLHVTLAMIYERLGDALRARSTAREALSHAIRADSETGRSRSHELLQQLISRPDERPTQRLVRPPSPARQAAATP